MKRLLGLFLLALVALGQIDTAFSQTNPIEMDNMTQDETDVMSVVRQLADLMIKKDTASMNMILADEYTLTHMTGYVQPKSEWFNEVSKESMKYYSAEEVDHRVLISGNTSSVTVRNLVDARIWGSRNIWRLQQKMDLKKDSGKWIIIKSVASTF